MAIHPTHAPENGALIARIISYRGEVYRLAGGGRAVRAISGRAWVTYAGRDIILAAGERAALAAADDFALVSALGRAPLVFEVLAASEGEPPANGLPANAPAPMAA